MGEKQGIPRLMVKGGPRMTFLSTAWRALNPGRIELEEGGNGGSIQEKRDW